MTINAAIRHCYEEAKKERKKGELLCSYEHIQLAHWLEELKERRERDEKNK